MSFTFACNSLPAESERLLVRVRIGIIADWRGADSLPIHILRSPFAGTLAREALMSIGFDVSISVPLRRAAASRQN